MAKIEEEKRKHCQRHNGPRVLSLQLELSIALIVLIVLILAAEMIQVLDSIPWVRCASGNVLTCKVYLLTLENVFL